MKSYVRIWEYDLSSPLRCVGVWNPSYTTLKPFEYDLSTEFYIDNDCKRVFDFSY